MPKLSAAAIFATLVVMTPLPAFAHHKAGHPDFPRIGANSETAPAPQVAKDCCAEMAKTAPEGKEKGCACCKKEKMDMPEDAHPDGREHMSGHPS